MLVIVHYCTRTGLKEICFKEILLYTIMGKFNMQIEMDNEP